VYEPGNGQLRYLIHFSDGGSGVAAAMTRSSRAPCSMRAAAVTASCVSSRRRIRKRSGTLGRSWSIDVTPQPGRRRVFDVAAPQLVRPRCPEDGVCCRPGSSYYSEGSDGGGPWLSNSVIAFQGSSPRPRTGSRRRRDRVGCFADWRVSCFRANDYDLVVSAADGSQQRILFPRAVPVGWLSNSSRLIFRAPRLRQRQCSSLFDHRFDPRTLHKEKPRLRGALSSMWRDPEPAPRRPSEGQKACT
jgi:hypothetical protein